jgi:hypothetical protein
MSCRDRRFGFDGPRRNAAAAAHVEMHEVGGRAQPGIGEHFQRVPELVAGRRHDFDVESARVHQHEQNTIPAGGGHLPRQARRHAIPALSFLDKYDSIGRFD